MFLSLQRLLELPDGVQVYPGHVAGSLCGAGMSSMHVVDDRLRAAVQPQARARRARRGRVRWSRRPASSAPRPPNMERIVELNRGPFVAAQPPLGPVESPGGATVLDVRADAASSSGATSRARSTSPSRGSKFATKAAFILTADEPVVIHASSRGRGRASARGAARGRALRGARLRHRGGARRETTQPVAVDELEQLVEERQVEILDVREKDERDEGYIDGSRHMPYRLVREFTDDFNGGRRS